MSILLYSIDTYEINILNNLLNNQFQNYYSVLYPSEISALLEYDLLLLYLPCDKISNLHFKSDIPIVFLNPVYQCFNYVEKISNDVYMIWKDNNNIIPFDYDFNKIILNYKYITIDYNLYHLSNKEWKYTNNILISKYRKLVDVSCESDSDCSSNFCLTNNYSSIVKSYRFDICAGIIIIIYR